MKDYITPEERMDFTSNEFVKQMKENMCPCCGHIYLSFKEDNVSVTVIVRKDDK